MPRNAADVKTPRPAPEEMRPLSEGEARAFLDAARESGDRFEALYVLAITTGLRRGELLGLRWEDADLERGTLRVGRALVRERGRHSAGETKTRRGRRQVNLTPQTVSTLRTHRKRQLEEKMRLQAYTRIMACLCHPSGHTPRPREPGQAILQTAPREGRPAGDTLP